jgi:hypothetical protein
MDSTHVLAAIRVLSRLELVAEMLRAALNDLATVAPDWLQGLAPCEWDERYGKRIEESRLPRARHNDFREGRLTSGPTVGELTVSQSHSMPKHTHELGGQP